MERVAAYRRFPKPCDKTMPATMLASQYPTETPAFQ